MSDPIGKEVEAAFETVRAQFEAEIWHRLSVLLAGPTERLSFTLSWSIDGVVEAQGAKVELPKARVVYR